VSRAALAAVVLLTACAGGGENRATGGTSATDGQRLSAGGVAPRTEARANPLEGDTRYGGDDGTVFESIFQGRPKGMPAYGGILSDTTIWQLVTYLRSRPVPEAVPTVSWAN